MKKKVQEKNTFEKKNTESRPGSSGSTGFCQVVALTGLLTNSD
jgi:hypothetical protein